MSETIELEWWFCGGISTLEDDFVYASADFEGKGKVYFLLNGRDVLIARFFERGHRVEENPYATRSDKEAIIGFKRLILEWLDVPQ